MQGLGLQRAVQRRPEPGRGQVQALAGCCEQFVRARQTAGRCPQPIGKGIQQAAGGRIKACIQIPHRSHKFAAHRNGHFRGAGGSGRSLIGGKIGKGGVCFMANGGNDGNRALGNGAHHFFLVEPPQILHRSPPAGNDDQVRAGNGTVGGQHVEPLDSGGNLGGTGRALHAHRPDDDIGGKTIRQAVQDVPDHGAGGGGHNADHPGQKGKFLLVGGFEQAFGGQLAAPLFQKGHQSPCPGRLHLLDNDLVLGLAGKGGQPPRGDHFKPLLGLETPARGNPFPGDGGKHRLVVLEIEVEMAGGGTGQAPHLAAHPHMAELVLHRALDGPGQLGNRIFVGVGGGRCHHGAHWA